MQTPSDEQLMLNVREGDLDAFERIVVRYQVIGGHHIMALS